MKLFADDRATVLGTYIKDTGSTVRATAGMYNISKSTVHTVVYK